MDYKAWVIPQDPLQIKLELSGFNQVFFIVEFLLKKLQKYPYYELLSNVKSKENLKKISETIKNEATDGLDFMAMITSTS